MIRLPARYDHVGSFLRPKYLLDARAQKASGEVRSETKSSAKVST